MSVAAAPAAAPALLVARGLAKRFGPTHALSGADLTVQERQIHALVGPSGAGKTTLIAVLSGLACCDEGEIAYRGFPIRLRSRADACRIGISVAAEEAALAPDLCVLDNLLMPAWRRGGAPVPREARERAAAMLASLGYAGPDLGAKAHRLSAAQARLVEIARALVTRAKLYIFDDPFTSLATRETEVLCGAMSRLRLAGCGVLVATRTLDPVLPLADRVTVLCAGRTTLADAPAAGSDPARLRSAMGQSSAAEPKRGNADARLDDGRRKRLAVQGLHAAAVEDVSLTVGAGTIRALHGFKGAGLGVVLDAIAGLRPRRGTVAVDGIALPASSTRAAAKAGLAIVPFDATLPLPQATARDNLALRAGRDAPGAWPLAALWASLDLPTAALDAPVAHQPAAIRRRIALACALFAARSAVLLDEPARGLDAVGRAAVRATLLAAAARGCAILAAWTDTDDLLAVSDTVTIVRDGRSVADLPAALLDPEALDLLATPAPAMARNSAVLATLVRENGGAAFWALRRDEHVLCLNAAVADADADPGFAPARACAFGQTQIAHALRHDAGDFVAEPDGTRATVLVPIRTRRGRPMGLIGLTLPPTRRPPPAAAIAFQIETLAATL